MDWNLINLDILAKASSPQQDFADKVRILFSPRGHVESHSCFTLSLVSWFGLLKSNFWLFVLTFPFLLMTGDSYSFLINALYLWGSTQRNFPHIFKYFSLACISPLTQTLPLTYEDTSYQRFFFPIQNVFLFNLVLAENFSNTWITRTLSFKLVK